MSAPGLGIFPTVPKMQLLPGDGEVQGECCQCCCGGGGEEGSIQTVKPGGDIQIPELKGSEGLLLQGAWELHLVMWEKCSSSPGIHGDGVVLDCCSASDSEKLPVICSHFFFPIFFFLNISKRVIFY